MNTQQGMNNRVAIVTGASAGIGRALVKQLTEQGIYVVANARRESVLSGLVQECNAKAKYCVPVVGDASDKNIIDNMFQKAFEEFGSEPNIVVANAGRGLAGSVLSSNDSEWDEVIQTNFVGVLRLIRAASIHMLRDSENKNMLSIARDIVIIGSNVGRHISPFSAMYGSTKAAVHSLAESLRRELGPQGIRVSLIEPGIVKSEFQRVAGYDSKWESDFMERVGPVLEPQDVSSAILYLLGLPAHVHMSDVLIRPTRQDYP